MSEAATGRRELAGRCHCGALAFCLAWPVGESVPLRACGCSFCTTRGAVWTSHPDAKLSIRLASEAAANRYRFGTRTADFFVCRTCGGVPVATSEIDGRLYAVVNVAAIGESLPETPDAIATDFDGEGTSDRLGRRAASWIPDVEISVV